MSEVQVTMPNGAFGVYEDEEFITTAMRVIAVGFSTEEGEWSSKYGTNFENDVFSMHRFCWCEDESCAWCGGNAPHFIFKPSGLKVWWYKYIGRGMNTEGDCPQDFLQTVFASHPSGMTLETAVNKMAQETEETAESFARIFEE